MSTAFTERIEEYLVLRRGLGYRLDRQARYLRSFAGFLDNAGHDGPVPLALTVRWATDTRSQDPHNPARRLSAIDGFLRYLAPLDGASEIPPPGLLGSSYHRTPPHIYTEVFGCQKLPSIPTGSSQACSLPPIASHPAAVCAQRAM